MPPEESSAPRHLVLNLDRELVVNALTEALELLEQLRNCPQDYAQLCPKLSLRVCYVLLNGELPEFRRSEVRRLAEFHSRLATSLLRAQRRLWEMHHPSDSPKG